MRGRAHTAVDAMPGFASSCTSSRIAEPDPFGEPVAGDLVSLRSRAAVPAAAAGRKRRLLGSRYRCACAALSSPHAHLRTSVMLVSSQFLHGQGRLQLSIIFAETMPHETDPRSRLAEQSMGS